MPQILYNHMPFLMKIHKPTNPAHCKHRQRDPRHNNFAMTCLSRKNTFQITSLSILPLNKIWQMGSKIYHQMAKIQLRHLLIQNKNISLIIQWLLIPPFPIKIQILLCLTLEWMRIKMLLNYVAAVAILTFHTISL